MDKVDNFVNEMMEKQFGKLIAKECIEHGKYEGYEKGDDVDCPACMDIENKKQIAAERVESINGYVASSGLPTKYHLTTFEDWIASNTTEQAAKDKMISFASGEIKRMLVIGTCGTGKTMLAAGIIRQMIENQTYPIYTTVPRLIRDIRDSWSKYDDHGNKISEQTSMNKYINASVLIVDELGSGRCSEDDKLIFSEILCDRYSEDLPTLLISNLDADAIKKTVLDERAADRMREEGQFVSMNWESKRG